MSASAVGREASEVALCTALIALMVLVALSAGHRAWPALGLDKGALIAVMSLKISGFVLLLAATAHLIIRATRRPSGRSFSLDTPQLIALGLGLASAGALLFGVPPTMAAFLTGMALGYVTIVRQASKNLRPMLDLLAVAFFVALGLQFDPGAVRSAPLAFLATLLFVSVGKPWLAMAFGTRVSLSHSSRLAVARSLGQIGEVSWVVAAIAAGSGLISDEARSLILNAAIVTLLVAAIDSRPSTSKGRSRHHNVRCPYIHPGTELGRPTFT